MKTITISQIQNIVCDYYKTPVEATQTKSRKRELVQSRQVTMYFARKRTHESLRETGLEVAGRDHATVLHACKTVNNLIDTDRSFKYDIYRIEQELINLQKKMSYEPVTEHTEVGDLHDFFPHPGCYPEIEFTAFKFCRPKMWIMKFRRFESKINNISRPLISHYANIVSCNDREMHGFRPHTL